MSEGNLPPVQTHLLGRTNTPFASVWLCPGSPQTGDPASVAAAAAQSGLPLDFGGLLAFWGGHLRGFEGVVSVTGPEDVARAADEKQAYDLTHAYLFEAMCALGRDTLDFYFVPIRRALEEHQLNGVLSALEDARNEGVVRFVGLRAVGSPFVAQTTIQLRDGFEAIRYDRSHDLRPHEVLGPVAKARRIGVVADCDVADAVKFSLEHPVVVRVTSPQEVESMRSLVQ